MSRKSELNERWWCLSWRYLNSVTKACLPPQSCLVHRVHYYCRQEKIWHFISCSPISPLLPCFIAAAVWAVVFSFPSIFTAPYCVCISRKWSPFTLNKRIHAAHWPGLIDLKPAGVSFNMHMCMCVCSIPPPACCLLPPSVITLMEERSRAAGNQSQTWQKDTRWKGNTLSLHAAALQ